MAFVIRLGDPGTSKPKQSAPLPPAQGLKSSGDRVAAAGEIGGQQVRFVAADTRTTVLVDSSLKDEIHIGTGERVDTVPVSSSECATRPDLPEMDLPLLPAPAAPADSGFESFRPVKTAVQLPPGAEARPAVTPTASPRPAAVATAGQQPAAVAAPQAAPLQPGGVPTAGAQRAQIGAGMHPSEPAPGVLLFPHGIAGSTTVAPTDASGRPTTEVEVFLLPSNQPGGAVRAFGMLMTVLIVLALAFTVFVMGRNDWSLDFGNLGGMLERAFGRTSAATGMPDELRGLDLTEPHVATARLRGGELAVTAQGVVKNNDTRRRQYIYVRAIMQRHGRDVLSAEAPAGNLFTPEVLKTLDRTALQARIIPGGSGGRNLRLDPGQNLEYMVVITGLPPDYTPARYSVRAKISQAELCEGR